MDILTLVMLCSSQSWFNREAMKESSGISAQRSGGSVIVSLSACLATASLLISTFLGSRLLRTLQCADYLGCKHSLCYAVNKNEQDTRVKMRGEAR